MPGISFDQCAAEIYRGINKSDDLKGACWKPNLFGFRKESSEDGAKTQYEVSVYQNIDEQALKMILRDQQVSPNGVVILPSKVLFQIIEQVDMEQEHFWFDYDPIFTNGSLVNKYHSNIVATTESTEAGRTCLSGMLALSSFRYMKDSGINVITKDS